MDETNNTIYMQYKQSKDFHSPSRGSCVVCGRNSRWVMYVSKIHIQEFAIQRGRKKEKGKTLWKVAKAMLTTNQNITIRTQDLQLRFTG